MRLDDVSIVQMGQSPSSLAYNENKNGLPLIQGNNDIKKDKTISRIWTSELTKTADKGDVILTVRAPVGMVGLAHNKVCIGRGVCSIKSDNLDFIYYFLKYFQPRWSIFEQGSTFTAVNSSDIRKLNILLPPLPEQKRIVKVLEVWDNYLEKLSKKIELKKNIKKGLMQKLLTGEIRLKGFDGEWKEAKLGEVCIIKRGEMITKNMITQGDIPVIAGGKQPAYYHDKYNYDGKTITVSGSGASAGFVSYFKKPIFASDCSVIKEIGYKSDIDFIYYQVLSRQKYIFSLQSGGAQPHVYPRDLALLKIDFVDDIQEQSAIAEILTTSDKEIELLEKKKKIIEEQKRFLLNSLVSGKIRVPVEK